MGAGKKAVFLDRDGTINVERGFVHRIEDFEFVDGAAELIGRLNREGYLVVVVTNQSGVARGLYTEEDVKVLHRYIDRELAKSEAHIDRFYYCPHHPEAPLSNYRKNCACRKPKPGLLLQAIAELDIDPEVSYMIGDRARDICAGKRAGIESLQIGEGEHLEGNDDCGEYPDLVVQNLREAVEHILGS
jgi:D-glycero-D-manno-heptose 1,7-bisphosphate phosphatase